MSYTLKDYEKYWDDALIFEKEYSKRLEEKRKHDTTTEKDSKVKHTPLDTHKEE